MILPPLSASIHLTAAAFVAVLLPAQQASGVGTAAPMLPTELGPRLAVKAERTPGLGSTLHIRASGVAATVTLAYDPVTAATRIDDDILVAGVLPDGSCEYCSVTRTNGEWAVGGSGVAVGMSYVGKLSCKHGTLAMLLGDGSIVAAPCGGSADLPAWSDFEYVGRAPFDVGKTMALAGLAVVSEGRIEAYSHPSNRPAFVRQPSGDWLLTLPSGESGPFLQIENPARVGGVMRFRANVAGPVFLEDEGVTPSLPVAEETSSTSWIPLPQGVSDTLRADRRYRLKSATSEGAWFHPAAIAGSAWSTDGVRLEECRVWEGGVRLERGSVPFRTSLEITPPFRADSIRKVAFVAITSQSAPLVAVRSGRTWLVPERVLMDEKRLDAARTAYALSVAVPLPADRQFVGKWVHVQLAVLAADGTVLGATGVRSVVIEPDTGSYTPAQEQAGRGSAAGYWSDHEIPDAAARWEQIVSR